MLSSNLSKIRNIRTVRVNQVLATRTRPVKVERPDLSKWNVADLLGLAKSLGLSATTKTRRPALLEMLGETV